MISPRITVNNACPGRPFTLTLIDGGDAIVGGALIGVVLVLI